MPIQFEPLKKWYGEQLWTEYMNEQNENVDLLNEKLELLETSESIRDTNEIARETAEGIRDDNEDARDAAELLRISAETARDTAEGIRESNETARETAYGLAEDARDGQYSAAEGARDTAYGLAEGARDGLYTTAEGARNTSYGQAEDARDGLYSTAEGARTTAFNAAETTRNANEVARGTAEGTRSSNETTRITNENARLVFEDYSSSKNYVIGNKVAYDGSSYRALKASKGVTPGTDSTTWLLIAKKGDPGDTWKPAVSVDGDLSWIKDSGSSTPAQRNIKGPQGDKGDTWKPSVSESGYLTWAKDSSGTTPTARDIKGPKGDTGDIANLTATHIANALGFTPIEYSAGANVQISEVGKISATDTKTTINGKTGAIAKADITALGIPGQDTAYTAGTNIEIASGVIKNIVTDQGTDPDWAGVKYKFVMINGELFAEVVAV